MPEPLPFHLLIIDGWHPRLLEQELKTGRLPAFSHLLRHGTMREAISVYPTVTPAALSSLATGLPPSAHGIHGIMWFDRQEDRYVHYWPSPQSLMLGTFGQVMRDILLNLNGRHLAASAHTLFETLESADVSSASVNFPICRGPYMHRGRIPLLVALLGGLPAGIGVRGPRRLMVGDMIRPLSYLPRGFFGRYGISDTRAARYTRREIRKGRSQFILTYLPENDMRSHQHGPMNVSLQALDKQIGHIMGEYGSWDDAVRKARWLLVGDHAQSEVGHFSGYSVNVFEAVKSVSVVPFGKSGLAAGGYGAAIAPNDRSALVYFANQDAKERLLAELCAWPSVERIFLREPDGWIAALDPATNNRFRFRRHGRVYDRRGGDWTLEGDPAVLDMRLQGSHLFEGRFPDALERLDGAMGSADAILDAKPGWEFTTGITMGHGNHGSLQAEDSTTAMLGVGVALPMLPRVTDVPRIVAAAFGIRPSISGTCVVAPRGSVLE